MTHRVRRAVSRLGAGSDRGSLPMAMLVILVGMLLSAAITPVVVNQVTETRTVAGRTQEMQAAQAGIDVALGQIRAATNAGGAGLFENLPPCVLTGAMDASGPAEQWGYRVAITYYTFPDANDVPQPLTCPLPDVPIITATLTATGGRLSAGPVTEDRSGTRTLEATYTFRTSNENITGGAIPLASTTPAQLCMDGGASASPADNTPVWMRWCKPGGSSEQRFAYTKDLNIKLVGSETSSAPDGMCLDAPVPRVSGTTPILFQKCLGLQPRQQWGLDDGSNFVGAGTGPRVCLNVRVRGDESELIAGACGSGDNASTFRPQPEAGAGMASLDMGQLVNFKQFSRCLDVTNFNRPQPATYMIVWFCKQDPNGNIAWNQKWNIPAQITPDTPPVGRTPDKIWTTDEHGVRQCLRSPGSTAANVYVTVTPCSGAVSGQGWMVYGDTGSYATSYRIVDSFGYCLTPTDLTVTPRDTHTDGTAKVKVAVCTKSDLQKWNAPPDLTEPLALTDTKEK
ncbi:RICIN domain-containing protein [Jidongwangia harbinensis]|uniref:RICIN domain-containing protein n=1 Tax=Jidongwangia harbinensis TaxID=2878561 RepID=UPI001CD96543|nr:ricin-type beta-trefoil lectin domain protein [Jidongwangia harbinensis]MCA2215344.1 ricin-type beta-trefoil lectin domain protein [Jidongwangia harbinensis]